MAIYWEETFEGDLSNWVTYGLPHGLSLTTDNPGQGSKSLRIPYPGQGFIDRFTGNGGIGTIGAKQDRFNLRFLIRADPANLEGKLIYIRADVSQTPNVNGYLSTLTNTGSALAFVLQNSYDTVPPHCTFPPCDTQNLYLNISLSTSWKEVEWEWIMNTPGVSNGSMRAWETVNEVQVLRFEHTGRQYRGPTVGEGSQTYVDNIRIYSQLGSGFRYLDAIAVGNQRIGSVGQILPPPLTLSPSTQPSGMVGVPYLGTPVTADGIAPRTFIASGLPPGLVLNTAGSWSGTPTNPGTFSTLVGATDSSVPARQGSITYPIVINPAAGDINTRNKRESCYSLAFPAFRVRPNPDGSLANAADRSHMAYQYAGIAPVTGGPINTRNKRESCYSIAFPGFRVRPNPDGSLANAADRTHMAYEYAGIATAAAPPGGGDGTIGRGLFRGIGRGMR